MNPSSEGTATTEEALWQSSALAFVRLDGEIITAANPAAGALAGQSPDELVGQPADLLLPPRERGQGLFSQATLAEVMPISCYVRHHSGEDLPALVWLTRTTVTADHVTAVIATVADSPHLEAAVEATTSPAGSPLSEEIEMVVQHVYAAGLALSAHRSSITADNPTHQLERAVDVLDRLLTELTAPRSPNANQRPS